MSKVIPKSQQEHITCATCDHVTAVSIIPEAWPHLYCTKCSNVYHEVENRHAYKKIRTNWGRRKRMNLVEAQAPLCECGGMFLFNAHPNCPNCGQDLQIFDHKPQSEDRLLHDDMVIFDGTIEYRETGDTETYSLE